MSLNSKEDRWGSFQLVHKKYRSEHSPAKLRETGQWPSKLENCTKLIQSFFPSNSLKNRRFSSFFCHSRNKKWKKNVIVWKISSFYGLELEKELKLCKVFSDLSASFIFSWKKLPHENKKKVKRILMIFERLNFWGNKYLPLWHLC